MKKQVLLFGIMILFLIPVVFADVRINEVMAETPSRIYGDSNCEWVEIFAESAENLINWTLDTGAKNITFNFNIKNYLIITGNKSCFLDNWDGVDENNIIEFSSLGLNDNKDNLSIFDNFDQSIDSMSYTNSHDDLSWQFCSDSWVEAEPTPGLLNSCDNGNGNDVDEEEIYIEFDFDEEDIINGKEFDIKVRAYNLEDGKYDIKIYIKLENENTVISEVYNKKDEEWESGNYYIDEIMAGSGGDVERFSIRIKEKHEDFFEDVEMIAKIRKYESSSVIDEIKEIVNLLEPELNKHDTNDEEPDNESEIMTTITGNVIKLGESKEPQESQESEDIKTQNNIIYESKIEIIKKYAIYGFALLCVALSILLIFKKLK